MQLIASYEFILNRYPMSNLNRNTSSSSLYNENCKQISRMDYNGGEETRRLVRELRQKTRLQAQQILAWRRAYKMQEHLIGRIQREKNDQLRALSAKILLFESRLIRKQKDISAMLLSRENVIHRQQRTIEILTNRLVENGLEVPITETTALELRHTKLMSGLDLDSLNDSDSAVVLEDVDSDSAFSVPLKCNSSVARSVSDAIDSRGLIDSSSALKYTCMQSSSRRLNGLLRRPEILETVYSVEEDADSESVTSTTSVAESKRSEANQRRDAFASQAKILPCELQSSASQCSADTNDSAFRSVSHLSDEETKAANPVKTYNRVMSNHRSVTKPKDVKYKRINKAKSKSLEELRGRLKNWVDQGSKVPAVGQLEHSQSYA